MLTPKGKAHGADQNSSAESENGEESENFSGSMASKGESHQGRLNI